jgi:hypothetical protein
MRLTLTEWLAENPGPYEVCLFTVKPETNPAEYTAGRVSVLVDEAGTRDGAVVFVQRVGGEAVGEIVLVEDALTEGTLVEGGFVAEYANLTVPMDDFCQNVAVTVRRKKDMLLSEKKDRFAIISSQVVKN